MISSGSLRFPVFLSWLRLIALGIAILLLELKGRDQGKKGFRKASSTQKLLRNSPFRPVDAANIQDHRSSIGLDSIQTSGLAEIHVSKHRQSSEKTGTEIGSLERRLEKISSGEIRSRQDSPIERGIDKIGFTEVRSTQIRFCQISHPHVGSLQDRSRQDGITEICTGKISRPEIRSTEIRSLQLGKSEEGFCCLATTQVTSSKIAGGKINPIQMDV